MRAKPILVALLTYTLAAASAFAQKMPLVYTVENTGANSPKPPLPVFNDLPTVTALPDPFAWADGRGRMTNYSDWEIRRNEIGAQIQNYEIGQKPPRPDTITASYSAGVLTVNVTVNGKTLTLTSAVVLPSGTGPFPAVIGMNSPSGSIPSSIFTTRNIAEITFVHNQVTKYGSPSSADPYFQLYPNLNPDNTGQYSAWAWGVSRLIDGLELVQNDLPIDLKHLCVTGCSYAGKMALFAGAFDERIALTIAQESGGGGATSWRYSHSDTNSVERIDNTDYNWFMNSMVQFSGNNVSRLPDDHHELMAMCAPRALYVTANPDYTWLANPSCYVASTAAGKVYAALGAVDRFGYSIVGGHLHCQVPDTQLPEIEAFVDKFLLGQDTANTYNVADNFGYTIDLPAWIPWTNPVLSNDTTYFAVLAYPPDELKGADTSITFRWKKLNAAQEYLFQLSTDPTFSSVGASDSTTDTVETVTGLSKGTTYYWRVQVKTATGPGIWSDVRQFITTVPIPAMPQLLSVIQDSASASNGGFRFTWRKMQYVERYAVQAATDTTFALLFSSAYTTDTTRVLRGFVNGRRYYWRVQGSNYMGAGPWSPVWSFVAAPTSVEEVGGVPTESALQQNYPNPFNPSTTIEYTVAGTRGQGIGVSEVRIVIYDVLGREVATLVNSSQNPGTYNISFDGSRLASGVYFYRLTAGEYVATKVMLLEK